MKSFKFRKQQNGRPALSQVHQQTLPKKNFNNQPLSETIPFKTKKPYDGSEDNVLCYRFPHMKFCGCNVNCLFTSFDIFQIIPGLFVCGFESGIKTRNLLEHNITHILNLTSKEYTKRTQYFEYLNIDILDNSEEDIKKFFRITNRFIETSKSEKGTILIHSVSVPLSACFAVAYLIGVKRIPIKGSIDVVLRAIPGVEIPAHFLKQLESYDLEKLAFVTIRRDKEK